MTDKPKLGRPEVVFTDEQIEEFGKLALAGCQTGTIASITGVDKDTLHNHCSTLLTKKRADRKYNLRVLQDKIAEAGNPAMLIFLGKNELEQTDKYENKVGVDKSIMDIFAQLAKADKK